MVCTIHCSNACWNGSGGSQGHSIALSLYREAFLERHCAALSRLLAVLAKHERATTNAGARTVRRLHNTHSRQKKDVTSHLWHPPRLTGPRHRTHRPLATRKRGEGTESSCSSATAGDPRQCMLASPPPTNEQLLRFFTYTAALSALMPASCTTPLQLASLGFRARLASAS